MNPFRIPRVDRTACHDSWRSGVPVRAIPFVDRLRAFAVWSAHLVLGSTISGGPATVRADGSRDPFKAPGEFLGVIDRIRLRSRAVSDSTIIQLRILGLVRDQEGLRNAAAARLLNERASSLTRVCDRPAERDLIARLPNPAGGRGMAGHHNARCSRGTRGRRGPAPISRVRSNGLRRSREDSVLSAMPRPPSSPCAGGRTSPAAGEDVGE